VRELGAIVVGKTKTAEFAGSQEVIGDWVDYSSVFNTRADGYLRYTGSSTGSASVGLYSQKCSQKTKQLFQVVMIHCVKQTICPQTVVACYRPEQVGPAAPQQHLLSLPTPRLISVWGAMVPNPKTLSLLSKQQY